MLPRFLGKSRLTREKASQRSGESHPAVDGPARSLEQHPQIAFAHSCPRRGHHCQHGYPEKDAYHDQQYMERLRLGELSGRVRQKFERRAQTGHKESRPDHEIPYTTRCARCRRFCRARRYHRSGWKGSGRTCGRLLRNLLRLAQFGLYRLLDTCRRRNTGLCFFLYGARDL